MKKKNKLENCIRPILLSNRKLKKFKIRWKIKNPAMKMYKIFYLDKLICDFTALRRNQRTWKIKKLNWKRRKWKNKIFIKIKEIAQALALEKKTYSVRKIKRIEIESNETKRNTSVN